MQWQQSGTRPALMQKDIAWMKEHVFAARPLGSTAREAVRFARPDPCRFLECVRAAWRNARAIEREKCRVPGWRRELAAKAAAG